MWVYPDKKRSNSPVIHNAYHTSLFSLSLSLSTFSVSVCLSPCVVVCCCVMECVVCVVCGCAWCVGVCGVVCVEVCVVLWCVELCVARLGTMKKNSVCRFKTSPCVRACQALDDVGSERWSMRHFSRAAAWRRRMVSRWKAWSIRRREIAWLGGVDPV